MYINDRDLIKIVIFPYFLGFLALNGITFKKGDYFNLCKLCYTEILDKYNKDIHKINKRLDKLTNLAIIEIINKQTLQVNTHKAIIIINFVAQMALENNDLKSEQEKIISLFEPFQEIESKMKMNDDEWVIMRDSANKQAKKIYNIFFNN